MWLQGGLLHGLSTESEDVCEAANVLAVREHLLRRSSKWRIICFEAEGSSAGNMQDM